MSTDHIDLPSRFDLWFSGTGVAQGDTEGDTQLEVLHRAYKAAARIKRGAGHSVRMELTHDTRDAILDKLWDYAGWCLSSNQDDPDRAEVAAAKLLEKRIQAVS